MSDSPAPVLRGDGLVLRGWTEADGPAVLELLDDVALRWSLSLRSVSTLEQAQAWLGERIARPLAWAVTDADTGAVIGRAWLHDLVPEDAHAEIGYGVRPGHRGKGVARRAAGLVTQYGFDDLGLIRINLQHAVGNAASCRVATACGYGYEGLMRKAFSATGGGFDDAHLHGRLRDDGPGPATALPLPIEPVEIAAGAYQLCVPDPDLDAAGVLAACADPMIKLFNAGPETLRDAYVWCRGRADWSSGTHASWLIKDTLGTLLGAVSLFDIDRPALAGQAGYWVAAPARGRGVAGAGLAAASRFGFARLGLNRVELFHAVENLASCRTALGAGFPVEGIHRQSYRYGDGLVRDEHSHARLGTD